ncbi:hypothetical protein DFH06DRAFT_1335687 [Mycena polygramma]|nr:hypothetical protein DFH06DRAFT_1335687 [Mycena polygramma]
MFLLDIWGKPRSSYPSPTPQHDPRVTTPTVSRLADLPPVVGLIIRVSTDCCPASSRDALAARCFHLVWLASALQLVADCFTFASPLTAQSSDPHAPLVVLLTLATILSRYPSSQVASGAALVSSLVFSILASVGLS